MISTDWHNIRDGKIILDNGLEIDVSNMKMNILKRILYRFRDIGYNIVEFISNVIIS